MIEKAKKSRKIFLSVFLLTVVFIFSFTGIKKADAGRCTYSTNSGTYGENIVADSKITKDRDACTALCDGHTGIKETCNYIDDESEQAKKSAIQSQSDFNEKKLGVDATGRPKDGGGVLSSILTLMGYLLQAAATLLIWVLDTNNIKNTVGNPVVYQVWVQIRDIMNIAFILVILFSAFCTIFQVEKFNYKKILITLVIMALLVNFSFPIARVIIDFANVIMYYLVKIAGFQATGDGGQLNGLVKNSQIKGIIDNPQGSTAYLIAAIIFTFIYAVTLLVIGVLFVVRLAVLTFLVMFSSVAFVGSIVPFLSTQAKRWWDTLFRYAFFGPIMIFMLYVSLKLMTIVGGFESNIRSVASAQAQNQDVNLITQIVMFTIPIAFLWIGLGIAQSMNIALANEVVGRGQKVAKWGATWFSGAGFAMLGAKGIAKTAKFGGKSAGSYIGRNLAKSEIGKYLVPRVYKEAWERRFKEAEQKAYMPAIGRMQNNFNKLLGGPVTDYQKLEKSRLVANKKKELEEISTNAQFMIDTAFNSLGKKDPGEALTDFRAAFHSLANTRDHDEFMWRIHDNLDNNVHEGGPTFRELGFNENNTTVDQKDVFNAVKVLMKHAGATDAEVKQELLDINHIAEGNASNLFGGVIYDSKIRDFRESTDDEAAFQFARKMRVMGESQDLVKKMHRTIFTDEHGHLTKSGEESLYHVINAGLTKNADRHRSDFYKDVAGNDQIYKQILEYADKIGDGTAELFSTDTGKREKIKANPEQAKLVKDWIQTVRRRTGREKFDKVGGTYQEVGAFKPDEYK